MTSTTPPTTHTRLAVALVAVTVVLSVVAPAAAGAPTAEETTPSLVVDLHEDGSATVTLVQTYDLETDDEKAAFESLQDDQQAREEAKTRFEDRMSSVAADASQATGRQMSVSDPSIDLRTVDGVGVVELSVTWSNLAAERDGRLVVSEPFASGFEPDRQFTVIGPDGYQLDGATPSPDQAGDASATWSAGTDLAGFEVAFAPAEDGTGDDAGETGDDASETVDTGDAGERVPGFGVGAALVALAAVALLAWRR